MKAKVAQYLIDLNHKFYTDFGEPFSATRGRIQPGVRRILNTLSGDETILDLGCGNGKVAETLVRDGHQGAYLGLDFSRPLLAEADSETAGFPVEYREMDLTRPLASGIQLSSNWAWIISFATLHHIPSRKLRLDLLSTVHDLLMDEGRFIHSNWQFLNSQKLAARIQDWGVVGLTEADVDENDYLLDWRSGGTGLRYVHHFSEAELGELAKASGFGVVDTFYSDGKEGNLAIYQEWKK